MGGSATSGKSSQLVLFDRKVSEADTYLQMMIDQTTKIEQRIDAIDNVEEREKYEALKEQANVSFRFEVNATLLVDYLSVIRRLCWITSNTQLSSFRSQR